MERLSSDPNLSALVQYLESLSHPQSLELSGITVSVTTNIEQISYTHAAGDEGDDVLGLLDATIASEGDEFRFSGSSDGLLEDSLSTTQTRSMEEGYSDSLELTYTSGISTFVEASLATQSGESGEDDDDIEELGSTDVLEYPNYQAEKEPAYIKSLLLFMQSAWSQRIINAFSRVTQTVMPSMNEYTRNALEAEFLQLMSSPLIFRAVTSPFVFYDSLSTQSDVRSLFSYIARSLVVSPCSESSCERVFSLVKWIVGDRRRQLRLKTLSLLLQVIVNSEIVQTFID